MTGARPPIRRSGTAACRYSELVVGDELWDSVTVTETHLVLGAALFNDPGPNHVNALQAAAGRFGARIAHGPLLVGIMDAALGNVLGSTIVALLDQQASFRHPVRIGDTVICRWTVSELADQHRFGGGGIVIFLGEAHNQDGRLLAESRAVLGVADEAIWDAASHLNSVKPPEERPDPR